MWLLLLILVAVAFLLVIDIAIARIYPRRPPVPDEEPTLDVQNHIGN